MLLPLYESHIDYIFFLQYEISDVGQVSLYLRSLFLNDCIDMMAKITLPCKSFLILTTLIWFFPSVSPHMFIKFTFINKGFITIITFVWFLPSMNPHKLAKITCIDMVCLQYESSYVCQFYSSLQKLSHIGYICMVSPQYE